VSGLLFNSGKINDTSGKNKRNTDEKDKYKIGGEVEIGRDLEIVGDIAGDLSGQYHLP
jgi:hypothetical protein